MTTQSTHPPPGTWNARNLLTVSEVDGAYESNQEAAKVIEEAQSRGDKSFLCCNDGKGIKQCIRVSDISTITEVPNEPPEKDEKEYRESPNINIYMK